MGDVPLAGPASLSPVPPQPVQELRDLIEEYDQDDLRPGLDWLEEHQPAPATESSILHLDFHPINLIRGKGLLTPIDWTEADVGDPHADVGTTLVLTECTPAKNVSRLAQLRVAAGRPFFVRRYLRAYREHFAIDRKKLAANGAGVPFALTS